MPVVFMAELVIQGDNLTHLNLESNDGGFFMECLLILKPQKRSWSPATAWGEREGGVWIYYSHLNKLQVWMYICTYAKNQWHSQPPIHLLLLLLLHHVLTSRTPACFSEKKSKAKQAISSPNCRTGESNTTHSILMQNTAFSKTKILYPIIPLLTSMERGKPTASYRW